jgi:signal transduction histidine kinase
MENDKQSINVVRLGGFSVPFGIGLVVTLIGLIVIGEWTFGIKLLAHLSPTDSSMKFNTSVLFFLSGLSLMLYHPEKKAARGVSRIFILFILTVAALTLSQYVFRYNLGLDELVFKDHPMPDITSNPGRMSPLVAFNFLLTGTALLVWGKTGKLGTRVFEYSGIAAFIMPVVVTLGYLFSASSLYSFTTVTGVALITALVFLVLLTGILAVKTERGFTTILLSRTRGGLVLRFLLPSSLIAIILLDWISLRAANVGIISESLVVPLGTIASGTVIAILIWRSAKLLYDADVKERNTFAELQTAYQTAEEANHAKDEFISIVSHELRTPLNSILGWIQIIKNDPTEENMRRAFEVVSRQSRNQLQLVEDLLDTSRIISGKMRLEIKPFAIDAVIAEAIETIRPAAEAKNIDLIFKKPGIVKAISGDADRLQQVFWNLLSNAVKFTPPDGTVKIALWHDAANINVKIFDTGEGIDAELLPYIFERFRQSDTLATRRSGGLGLGLSLVRSIIELHGGDVTAASDGTGHGSTFTVRLPMRETN